MRKSPRTLGQAALQGHGRQKAEKGHGRNLLNMEDEACRPGPEGMVNGISSHRAGILTVVAPDLSCHAWPARLTCYT